MNCEVWNLPHSSGRLHSSALITSHSSCKNSSSLNGQLNFCNALWAQSTHLFHLTATARFSFMQELTLCTLVRLCGYRILYLSCRKNIPLIYNVRKTNPRAPNTEKDSEKGAKILHVCITITILGGSLRDATAVL